MKKFLLFMVILAMLAPLAALAEEPALEEEVDIGSLRDLKIGQLYEIEGYAQIMPMDFNFYDHYAEFVENANYVHKYKRDKNSSVATGIYAHPPIHEGYGYYARRGWMETDAQWIDSGFHAQFAWLQLDIISLQMQPVDYLQNVTVEIVYDNEFRIEGTARQINYEYIVRAYEDYSIWRHDNSEPRPNLVTLNPANPELIDFLYTGTYAFYVTVPTRAIEDESSPLRMEITIGGHELTYIIRK